MAPVIPVPSSWTKLSNCYGNNEYGQLGLGDTTKRNSPSPVTALGTQVASLTLADDQSCAVLKNGTAMCWGRNDVGQFGLGDQTNRDTPTAITALDSAVASITLGTWHSCVLMVNGSVLCMGYGHQGVLGHGTDGPRASNTPVLVQALRTDVLSLHLRWRHSCAVMRNRTAMCWGVNNLDQYSLGQSGNIFTPTPIPALGENITSIVFGISAEPIPGSFSGKQVVTYPMASWDRAPPPEPALPPSPATIEHAIVVRAENIQGQTVNGLLHEMGNAIPQDIWWDGTWDTMVANAEYIDGTLIDGRSQITTLGGTEGCTEDDYSFTYGNDYRYVAIKMTGGCPTRAVFQIIVDSQSQLHHVKAAVSGSASTANPTWFCGPYDENGAIDQDFQPGYPTQSASDDYCRGRSIHPGSTFTVDFAPTNLQTELPGGMQYFMVGGRGTRKICEVTLIECY